MRLRRLRANGKLAAELAWWRGARERLGDLEAGIPFYRWAFTEHFGAALREIARVARSRATLLVLVDIDHEPTATEPHRLGWDLVDRLSGDWSLVERRDYERPTDNLYDNLRRGRPFDHRDARARPGVLSARLERRG